MPRRGGFTTTTSGADPEARAKAVASPASKRTPVSPRSAALRRALATASTLVSMPTTSRPGAAQCSAKPPTPQYRSHSEAGASALTHSRTCA